eukprot:78200_1
MEHPNFNPIKLAVLDSGSAGVQDSQPVSDSNDQEAPTQSSSRSKTRKRKREPETDEKRSSESSGVQTNRRPNSAKIQRLIQSIPDQLVSRHASRPKKVKPAYNAPLPSRVSHRAARLHEKTVNCVRWSKPYGHLLATASMDNTCKLWDVIRTSQEVKHLCTINVHSGAVRDCQWNWDGSQLLSVSYDKTAVLSDVLTGKAIQRFSADAMLQTVAYHPGNRFVFVAGGHSEYLQSWDVRTNKQITSYKGAQGQIQSVAFLPDSKSFVTASNSAERGLVDQGIQVWDFDSGAAISSQIYTLPYVCSCVRVHPGRKHFLAQSAAEYLAVFGCKPPYRLNKYKRFEGHKTAGFAIQFDFSADGSTLVSGSTDGGVVFFDYTSSRIRKRLNVHEQAVTCVEYHPLLPT